ncbi:hypothetical protein O7623_29740 [Solwaraspora sp. WMMD791]|uniref:hypothetical protein n=1 Tax=Solwaraspora sp. WMMD791 TaxID=3016086 RepID=UPI00249CB262|nr:hypothetical protein [Solwaraspora sp. WMMD791]WFE27358.1 hypothetical protein O7623_29740 [Solwaraspora sp. WMMD791]
MPDRILAALTVASVGVVSLTLLAVTPAAARPEVTPAAARPAVTPAGDGQPALAGQWRTAGLGGPAPDRLTTRIVGAVTVTDTPTAVQRPYVFSIVGGNLHATWSSGAGTADPGWTWTTIGAPGTRVVDGADVITVQTSPGGPTRPYVFVRTDDGRLWLASGMGSVWNWRDLGTPPGTTVMRTVGAVAVRDGVGAAQRPYVFVTGWDGRLWLAWWDGARWRWDDRGTPAVDAFTSIGQEQVVGVALRRASATSAEHPQAFLLDRHGDLWRHGWHGSGWAWTNHGTPQDRPLAYGVAAVTTSAADGASRPYAYVGRYGWMFSLSLADGGWRWVDHGVAGVEGNLISAGAVAPAGSDEPPYVFVTGVAGGPIAVNGLDGSVASWAVFGGTDAADLWPRGGAATTVRDDPAGPDRPYVFYWSRQQPAQLTVLWRS